MIPVSSPSHHRWMDLGWTQSRVYCKHHSAGVWLAKEHRNLCPMFLGAPNPPGERRCWTRGTSGGPAEMYKVTHQIKERETDIST